MRLYSHGGVSVKNCALPRNLSRELVPPMTTPRCFLLAALVGTSCAFQLSAPATTAAHQLRSLSVRPAVPARVAAPLLAEDTSTELSDETIQNVAATASGDEVSWPTAQPKPATPEDTTVGPSEGFDPRLVLYVSLPALVLVGQLFFTFSRDALGDVALGPAVMDLYLP